VRGDEGVVSGGVGGLAARASLDLTRGCGADPQHGRCAARVREPHP